MKKHLRKFWSLMLILLLCMAMFPVSAFAAGTVIATATIPVSVSVSGEDGTLDSDIPVENYTFTLTAVNNAPMPESNTVTITGEGSAEFKIDYETLGVYQYTLTQDASELSGNNSLCNDRGNYDSTVYYITVTVQNTDKGGFGVVVVAYKGSTSGSKSDIKFVNTYDPVPYTSVTVNKIWTDNNQTRPDSINVQLLDGDEVIDTVELDEETGWTYTWSNLDPYGDHSWSVSEIEVNGYKAEYSTSVDGIITIHNIGDSEGETETETESGTETETDTTTTESGTDAETTTTESSTNSETTNSDDPATGDDSNIMLYSVLMVLAAAVIASLTVFNKKRKVK